jgi:hypothetical protein
MSSQKLIRTMSDPEDPAHALSQVEHRIWVDTVPAADDLGGLEGAAAGEHCQPGEQPLFGLGEQLVGPVDGGP